MVEDILSVVYLQWLPRLTQLDSSGGGTVTGPTAIYLVIHNPHRYIQTLQLLLGKQKNQNIYSPTICISGSPLILAQPDFDLTIFTISTHFLHRFRIYAR